MSPPASLQFGTGATDAGDQKRGTGTCLIQEKHIKEKAVDRCFPQRCCMGQFVACRVDACLSVPQLHFLLHLAAHPEWSCRLRPSLFARYVPACSKLCWLRSCVLSGLCVLPPSVCGLPDASTRTSDFCTTSGLCGAFGRDFSGRCCGKSQCVT